MRLTVVEGERFSCQGCTDCCRGWHVELTGEERERIPRLEWPAGDELAGVRAGVLLRHSGKVYLAHRGDGSCVFLNLGNGRCRIHEVFGGEAKPVGCRLYPFQVVATLPGEVSATARFDCPSVRGNVGEEHERQVGALKKLVGETGVAEGFDARVMMGLKGEQVRAVAEFVATLLGGFGTDEEKAVFIYQVAGLVEVALAGGEGGGLTREALGAAFPGIRRRVQEMSGAVARRPGMLVRVSFRTLLAQYLRRDEDLLDGRASRAGRLVATVRLVMGGGSFRGLGVGHPGGSLARAGLFGEKMAVGAGEAGGAVGAYELLWRVVRVKLESLQFMGSAAGGRDLVAGLRGLALMYPLVRAVAKYVAGNRGAGEVKAEDVSVGVGVIDHAHGRSAVLSQGHARSQEGLLLRAENFLGVVGWV